MNLNLLELYNWLKSNKLLLLIYGAILISIIVIAHFYVDNEVKNSEEEISRIVSLQYEKKEGYCFRENRSYTVVSYALTSKPSIGKQDSSVYIQMFGANTNYYFKATNKPWNIIQYKKDGSSLCAYRIEPLGVALRTLGSNSPGTEFRELYNNIYDGYNVSDFNLSPEDKKTRFHYIEKRTAELGVDTLWYDDYSDRLLFTKSCIAVYRILEDYKKIDQNLYSIIIIFILLETVLFTLFMVLKNKLKNKKISLFQKIKIPFAKKDLSCLNDTISDAEYEVLMHKINPINFMNPYDSEKVKVANDLYSALLKSRDNETIIRMIEEKAKDILKI